jgi:DNA polymerase-1
MLARWKVVQAIGVEYFEWLNPVTGRFHAQFAVAAAETGRFSCREPNLQQLPAKRAPAFRKVVVARPGFLLVGADYAQIEVRVAAALSNDAALNELLRAGRDIHRETAASIAGVAYDDVTDEQRKAAKAVMFGSLFGIGPAKLSAYAHASYDVAMSEEEGRTALDAFFARFPELKRWRTDNFYQCQARGFIEIPTSGRVIELEWSTLKPKALPFPLCCNAPVQGSAADLIMLALQWVDRRLVDNGVTGVEGLIACVHDELLLEVREEHAERAREILQQEMTAAFVRLFSDAPTTGLVDIKTGPNWGGLQ